MTARTAHAQARARKPARQPTHPASAGAALLAAVLAAAVAAVSLPAGAEPARPRLARAEVLDTIVLPVELPGGLRLREVSGLAWDRRARELVAVTDRGIVARWAIEIQDRRLAGAAAVQAGLLSPEGVPRVNAESVDVLPPDAGGGLVVVDEGRQRILVVGASAPVAGVPRQAGHTEDGTEYANVEAIAWHRRHGVLAARQYPAGADRAARLHRVYAGDGRQWTFSAASGGRASIKAMHLVDDNRLLLLEKVAGEGQRHLLLREMHLDECASGQPCQAAAAPIDTRAFERDDNFEGLACIDTELCLLASDDGRQPRPRTVLALVALHRLPAAK